jgi:serine phosphatase RsbU (regulator of sigma subunit)/tetratricopeptide (TPR) repeat protein
MYRFRFFSIALFLILPVFHSPAQNPRKIDSLLRILPTCKEDTEKIKILCHLGWEISYKDLNEGLKYSEESMNLAIRLNDVNGIRSAYHNIGSIYLDLGDLNKAGEFLLKELHLLETKDLGHSRSGCYIELGLLYETQNNYAKALHFDSLALEAAKKSKDKSAMSVCYVNMSGLYEKMGLFEKAIEVNEICLKINQESKYQEAIAAAYMNIGEINLHLKNYDAAHSNFLLGLQVYRTHNLKFSIPAAYSNLGDYYLKTKLYKTAIIYYDSALTILTGNAQKEKMMEIYDMKSQTYEGAGDYKLAFFNHKIYAGLKDSLFSDKKSKEFTRNELKYEFDKKEQAAKMEQVKKDASMRLIFIVLTGGLIALLIFLFYINRSNRQKKRINEQLEQVNALIQEKNKNITDSINYAKRIQRAILPSKQTIRDLLPSSFILLKPKDIVSGDFYWIEKIAESEGKILFAAVDCTGHGVPGAMVSVVGYNNLNRCVKEFRLRKPAQILDKLNELVQETFDNSDDEVRDGMDISLCMLDSENGILEYAGANNPLWIIRKDAAEGVIQEIKGDKQPIGKYAAHKPFTNHQIKLNKGDTVYIFSDGFADQFGGEKGKKFKYKSLQKLLHSIQHNSMPEQEEILLKTFIDWQNVLEQVDDVLIVGFRY